MPFKFKLETLLKMKRLDESLALERLAACVLAVQDCTSTIDDLRRERKLISCGLSGAESEGMKAADFCLVARLLDAIGARIESLSRQKHDLDTELRELQDNARASVSQRKEHENIKERARLRWLHSKKRRQRIRLDEAGANLSRRKSQAEEKDE